MARHIIVMGVSGCGKSTIGRALAAAMQRPFVEGDNYHSPANITKMSAGQPLDNTDRQGWITALCGAVNRGAPSVISCSALSNAVRGWLRAGLQLPVVFIHLAADKAVITQRLSARKDHFFDPALLSSQFAALEPAAGAIRLDAHQSVAAIIEAALAALDE